MVLCASIISDALDAVLESLSDFLASGFITVIKWLLNAGLLSFNVLLKKANALLTENPVNWLDGQGWSFIKGIEGIFVGIGCSLVVIFFLMGFCQETIDAKQEVRPEWILRSFIKLTVAEYFVANSFTIANTLCSCVSNWVALITKTTVTVEASLPDDISSLLKKSNWNSSLSQAFSLLPLILIGFIFVAGMVSAGAIIVYEAFVRMIKVLCVIPWGCIASSTIAGNHTLSHTAVSYYKYLLNTILQAITIVIAINLAAKLCNTSSLELMSEMGGSSLNKVFGYMIERVLIVMAIAGSVKAAENMTQRALGL